MFFKINKKRGESSFYAIKKFAKQNNIKKIGHSGTLDPLAEGLLIVATDEDTKLLFKLANDTKEYFVKATFHCYSKSYDEGEEVFYLENKKLITKEKLIEALQEIKKQKKQIPPIFSAKKINGIRSYELARKNVEFSLKECDIEIFSIRLDSFDYERQSFSFYVKVSKGTYIRSLVHDIGLLLNTDAVVNVLKREAIGNISLGNVQEYKPINEIKSLFNIQLYTLEANELSQIKSKSLYLDRFKNITSDGIFLYNNQIIAIGKIANGLISFEKILFNRLFLSPLEEKDHEFKI
ncbi:tRNA pseudouridine synthase B [Metamycoplasma auris 15026]|uniref:tRNA pseudouridine(55) synthase n=1 Tax=Metamycoplasma auris 15026 TaxID=1188233 RepID=N9UZ68_9BACT|nr:tRNA pseudouridine(55) synthase TruB [Metamycoplasma auris]ENY68487.1 tRNA pseudouridine synthase B [Metamycoplasma auris 15026]